ncbi:hypothetical protein K1X76_10915 [bacterium]|nr:hypothetical protein [bacterium]
MSNINFYLLNALASTNPNINRELKTLLGKAAGKNENEEAQATILRNKAYIKELIDLLKLPESQRSSFTENTMKALSKKGRSDKH